MRRMILRNYVKKFRPLGYQNYFRAMSQQTQFEGKKQVNQNPKPKHRSRKSKRRKEKPLPKCEHPFFDAHCHIDLILAQLNRKCGSEESAQTWASLAEKCIDANPDAFQGCLTISCAIESYDETVEMLENDQTNLLYGAFGIHPHNASTYSDTVEENLIKAMDMKKVVAWGECGLDYYRNNSPPDVQRKVFIRQIQQAVACRKPLIVHSREAEEDTIKIMQEHLPSHWPVHLHCFTGSSSMALSLLDLFPNLYIGFTGVITFGSADSIREVVAQIPTNRLLLETDGPYMAPTPYRGSPALPGHIPSVAAKMAEIQGISVEELMQQVWINTKAVYFENEIENKVENEVE